MRGRGALTVDRRPGLVYPARMFRGTFIALCALALILAACGGEETSSEAIPAADPSPTEPFEVAPPEPASPSLQAVAPVLSAYEDLRASLANGDTEQLFEKARLLEQVAGASGANLPRPQAELMNELATAATRLRETPAGDLPEARRSFGEVSRHLVALLEADDALASAHHIFACEDALGFPRWVQPVSAEMASPYTDEPCGTAVSE